MNYPPYGATSVLPYGAAHYKPRPILFKERPSTLGKASYGYRMQDATRKKAEAKINYFF